jgi:hypothetical protein
VYDSSRPLLGPAARTGAAPSFSDFRDQLTPLLSALISQPESPARRDEIARRDELQSKLRAGAASTQDQVDLSASLIRLGEPAQAAEVLTTLARREPRNFMVFANLGTASEMEGRLAQAAEYLQQARDVWPGAWPGLTAEQLAWYQRAEAYQARLVRLRLRESVGQRSGQQKTPEGVDDLFGVRFEGEKGRYEPGRIAPAEKAKLPKDAVAVVEQLLIWLPVDTRLYWLLGEVLNAEGDIASAATILDECAGARRYNARILREHRRTLQEAKAALAPVVSPLDSPTGPEEVPAGWSINGRLAALVGAGAGLLIVLLVYLQVRDLSRRRRSKV